MGSERSPGCPLATLLGAPSKVRTPFRTCASPVGKKSWIGAFGGPNIAPGGPAFGFSIIGVIYDTTKNTKIGALRK